MVLFTSMNVDHTLNPNVTKPYFLHTQNAEEASKAFLETNSASYILAGPMPSPAPWSLSTGYTPLLGQQALGMARSSRPFQTDLRAHPTSSIRTGVAFVKGLSASQEPRKTLLSGKALKWEEPEALRTKMRFKVLLQITSILGLGVFWVWEFWGFFRSHSKVCFLFPLVMHLPASL